MPTLTEKINRNEALWVLTLSKDDFYKHFPLVVKSNNNGESVEMSANVYYKFIKEYIVLHQKSKFAGIDIHYKSIGGGRMYATNTIALQRVHYPLRTFLTKGIYHDYDQKNAHPTFMLYYFQKHDIDCTFTREYVTDRDIMLQKGHSNKGEMLKKMNTDNARYSSKKRKTIQPGC